MGSTQPEATDVEQHEEFEARYQAKQRLRIHYEVVRALTDSDSVEDTYREVLRATCEGVGWELGMLWIVDHEANRLYHAGLWHAPTVRAEALESSNPFTTFARGEGLPGRVWATGQAIWIPEILRDEGFVRASSAAEAGLHSALSFPISSQGEIIAIIECFSYSIHQPQEELLELLSSIGGQIGNFIERRRAEEHIGRLNGELHQRVNELQTLLDVLPVGIAVAHDAQCLNMSINPAGAQLLGLAPNANPSKGAPSGDQLPFKVLRNGEEVPVDELPMQYAAAHREALRDVELDVVRADGTLLNLYEYASPLYDEQGEVRGCLGVFVDITPRKAAERRLALQYEIARILSESNNIEEAATQVLQAICTTMKWLFGALWRIEPESSSLTNIGLWHAADDRYKEFAQATRQSHIVNDDSLLHRVWRNDRSMKIDYLREDSGSTRARMAEDIGLHQAFAFPVHSGDEVIAVLECLSKYIRQPDASLITMFEAISDQFGTFLDRKRAEQEVVLQSRQQRLLAQAGAVLSNSLDYETCLKNMAEMIVPELADWCAIDILDADEHLYRLTAVHVDPAKVQMAYDMQRRYPPNPETGAAYQVLRSGQSRLIPDITDEMLVASIKDPEQLALARQLQFSSAIVVPLIARDRRLGVLTLIWAESARHYDENDLILVEELGRRAALAIDNTQLYSRAQELNVGLERGVAERTAQLEETNTRLLEEIVERRQAEEQVRVLNAELEQRVAERTAQLERVNEDLKKEVRERQHSAQTMRTLLKRTRELHRMSEAIGKVRTPDQVMDVLLKSSYLRGVNRVSIAIFDKPWIEKELPPDSCTVLAEWNKDARQPRFLDQRFSLEEYGVAPPYRFGEPIIIPRMKSYTSLSEHTRQRFADLRTRSLIIFPLTAVGQWYGLLSLHFRSRRATIFDDPRHVRGLVDEAAIVIHNTRLLASEASARREAEEANALKIRFLAMISHELRTPLTSIKGFATTLLAEDVQWPSEHQLDFLQTISEESDKLGDLIEQLLDLSRMEAGMLRIVPEAQALESVIDIAITQLKTIATNHKLVVEVRPDLPPVNVDGLRISQVLTNLVGNAARYSPLQTQITISAQHIDDMLQIDVVDCGPGIPMRDRARIFEPFRQLGDETTGHHGGAGLGLAICKGLVEAHGGQIWVQNRSDSGTVISFTVPVANST